MTGQVQELGLWLWWLVESLSNELYSIGRPGSLGNLLSQSQPLDLIMVLSPNSTGFEPRVTCISPAEYPRGLCQLFSLKPFNPESQQAGRHSPQAESWLEGSCRLYL